MNITNALGALLPRHQGDFFLKASKRCLMALAFLLPVWFLPITNAPVEFNKVLLVSVLVIVSFGLYLIDSILRGRVAIGFHWIFIAMGAVLAVWLVSSLVSQAGTVSLWGSGAEPNSFFSVLTFMVLAWLVGILFSDEADLRKMLKSLLAGAALSLLFVLLSYFGAGKLLGGIFATPSFNTIGSWNAVAVAAGFFVVALYPLIGSSFGILRLFSIGLFFVLLLVMSIINFPIVWVLSAFFAVTYLSYSIWRRKISKTAFVVTLVLLAVSLSGFMFQGAISNLLGVAGPVEVGISHPATFGVLKQSLKEDLFFGKGPSTFGYLWDLYKPNDVNRTLFWNVRFTTGSSYLLSLLGEIGLLAWLLFILFLGGLWYLGLKMVTAHGGAPEPIRLSIFFLFTYTLLAWLLYPVGYTLVALGFLAVGLMLALLRTGGVVRAHEILIFSEGPTGFVSALVVVLLMIGSLGGLYVIGSRYAGQILFARAVNGFNANGNTETAEKRLLSAIRLDQRNDSYFRTLAQVYMVRAQELLQDQSTPKELLGSKFKDVLDRAVSASQNAVVVSPLDFGNYRALGKIYEFLVSAGAEGAAVAADVQYTEALKHAPKNPALHRDKALVHMTQYAIKPNNDLLKKSEEALLKAIELKPDYAEGQFLLAQVYDASGNVSEAIRRGETAALLSPNDIGALFQLGLLYYKNDRLSDAEIVFARAVTLNSNYSNARYFLGLIYSRTRRKAEAVAEFEKITALNPDNPEVAKILANLHAGKAALAGISPPGVSPASRKEAPVKESDQSSSLKGKAGR